MQVIPEGAPARLYLDVEYQIESNPQHDGDQMIDQLKGSIIDALQRELGVECSRSRTLICTLTETCSLVTVFPDGFISCVPCSTGSSEWSVLGLDCGSHRRTGCKLKAFLTLMLSSAAECSIAQVFPLIKFSEIDHATNRSFV